MIQNNGSGTIAIIAAGSQPSADADYAILLAQSCGISSSLIEGTLWAKALTTNPVVVSVTE